MKRLPAPEVPPRHLVSSRHLEPVDSIRFSHLLENPPLVVAVGRGRQRLLRAVRSGVGDLEGDHDRAPLADAPGQVDLGQDARRWARRADRRARPGPFGADAERVVVGIPRPLDREATLRVGGGRDPDLPLLDAAQAAQLVATVRRRAAPRSAPRPGRRRVGHGAARSRSSRRADRDRPGTPAPARTHGVRHAAPPEPDATASRLSTRPAI